MMENMIRSDSHSLEGAGSQNSIVLLGVECFAKKDVASNRTR